MTTSLEPSQEELAGVPGAELVVKGLKEIHQPEPTEHGLLILVASPRLRSLGFHIPHRPDISRPYEHRLYELLEREYGPAAYSRYNSLLRRIVSFCRALEHRRRG